MKSFLKFILGAVFVAFAVGAAFALGRWPVNDWSTLTAPSSSATAVSRAPAHSVNQAPPPRHYISMDEAKKSWADIMAGNLPNGARNQTTAILGLLNSMDPEDAAVLAASLPVGSLRSNALRTAGNQLKMLDPKAAFDWALQLPGADAQMELRNLMIPGTGPLPEVAKLYLDKIDDPAARTQAINAIAIGQAQRGDPAGALAWVAQNSSGAALQKSIEAIFQSISEPAVQVTTNSLGQTMTSFGSNKQDLSAAASLLGQITDPATRASAIGILADGWGKTDLTAALTWAQSLPDSDAAARSTALNSLVSAMSKNDPAGALAFIKNSPDPNAYITLAPNLSVELAKYDPQAAYAYVQGLPDGATKDQSLGNVLVAMGSTDFKSAWNDATSLPNGAAKDVAMEGLMGELATSDPAQAATLLSQFTPGSEGERYALHNLVPTWAKLDPQATSQWLNTSPPGRGVAVVQFIETIVSKDPATALQWANTIKDATGRTNNVNRALNRWPASDPAGKLNAIMTANVSDEQRIDLVNKFNEAQSAAK